MGSGSFRSIYQNCIIHLVLMEIIFLGIGYRSLEYFFGDFKTFEVIFEAELCLKFSLKNHIFPTYWQRKQIKLIFKKKKRLSQVS